MVVAAGSGRRFGADKLRARLGGRRVLDVSVAVAARATDGVVVVVHPDHLAAERHRLGTGDLDVPVRVVAGGETRSASVRAGLDAVPATSELVAVHDGARPLASEGLWRRVLAALEGPGGDEAGAPGSAAPDGVVPVVPVTDTLRRVDGGVVDRAGLVAVQTPQAFRAAALRAAHAGGGDATDDAGLVEAVGGRIAQVAGEASNLKITTPDDLVVAAALWAGRETGSPVGPDTGPGVA
ncbi:MAG: 2-C-methyl-D-erythritol 4-phosphate cytidylyltransferase, partial [Actinomyces sp.]